MARCHSISSKHQVWYTVHPLLYKILWPVTSILVFEDTSINGRTLPYKVCLSALATCSKAWPLRHSCWHFWYLADWSHWMNSAFQKCQENIQAKSDETWKVLRTSRAATIMRENMCWHAGLVRACESISWLRDSVQDDAAIQCWVKKGKLAGIKSHGGILFQKTPPGKPNQNQQTSAPSAVQGRTQAVQDIEDGIHVGWVPSIRPCCPCLNSFGDLGYVSQHGVKTVRTCQDLQKAPYTISQGTKVGILSWVPTSYELEEGRDIACFKLQSWISTIL